MVLLLVSSYNSTHVIHSLYWKIVGFSFVFRLINANCDGGRRLDDSFFFREYRVGGGESLRSIRYVTFVRASRTTNNPQ